MIFLILKTGQYGVKRSSSLGVAENHSVGGPESDRQR